MFEKVITEASLKAAFEQGVERRVTSASPGGAAWPRACRAGRGALIAGESRVLAMARLGVFFS